MYIVICANSYHYCYTIGIVYFYICSVSFYFTAFVIIVNYSFKLHTYKLSIFSIGLSLYVLTTIVFCLCSCSKRTCIFRFKRNLSRFVGSDSHNHYFIWFTYKSLTGIGYTVLCVAYISYGFCVVQPSFVVAYCSFIFKINIQESKRLITSRIFVYSICELFLTNDYCFFIFSVENKITHFID